MAAVTSEVGILATHLAAGKLEKELTAGDLAQFATQLLQQQKNLEAATKTTAAAAAVEAAAAAVPPPRKSGNGNGLILESFEHVAKYGKREAPVVTMFSGGLDSTYLLLRLQQLGFTNIHAVAVDVGEPVDVDSLSSQAARFGARFQSLDGREILVREGVMPAIRAHARYMGTYPISSSLSRPVIARLVADYAATLVSGGHDDLPPLLLHTANLSQNSLPRLNNTIRRHGHTGHFGSPYVRSVVSREQKAQELGAAHPEMKFMSDRKLSGDENLWCREFESGPLDDPEGFDIPESAHTWTLRETGKEAAGGSSSSSNSPASSSSERLTLGFEDGNLVSVNGSEMALIDAIALLNREVGKYGHGRFVGLEPIGTDEKVLEVREAPAAAIIMDALRHLEIATLETPALHLKQQLEAAWIREAVSGRWGSTSHAMSDAGIASASKGVGGTVTFVVDPIRYLPCSIVAQNPRYIRDRDQWELEASKGGICVQ